MKQQKIWQMRGLTTDPEDKNENSMFLKTPEEGTSIPFDL